MWDRAPRIAPGPVRWHTTADVLDDAGHVAARGVPVLGGSLVVTADARVPDSATVTLPGEHAGVVLDPSRGGVVHARGVTVRLTVHIASVVGPDAASATVGTLLVDTTSTQDAGVRIEVTLAGLARRAADHKTGAPTSLPAGRTTALAAIAHVLGEDRVPVRSLVGVDDRAVVGWAAVGDDRLETVELWSQRIPAVIRPDRAGGLVLAPLPSLDAAPSHYWHAPPPGDEGAGAMVDAPEATKRSAMVNHIVVMVDRGDGQERHPVHVTRPDTHPHAPSRLGLITHVMQADGITTDAEAHRVAWAEMDRLAARAAVRDVTLTRPDLSVELWDTARVIDHHGGRVTGRVLGTSLPLTMGDTMTVRVGGAL